MAALLLSLVKDFNVDVWEVRKYSMVMSHALVNFSLSLRLEICGLSLELEGSGIGEFAHSHNKGK